MRLEGTILSAIGALCGALTCHLLLAPLRPLLAQTRSGDTTAVEQQYPSGMVMRWKGDTVWRTYASGKIRRTRTVLAGDSLFAETWYVSGAQSASAWLLRGDSAYLVSRVDSAGRRHSARRVSPESVPARLMTWDRRALASVLEDRAFRERLGITLPPQ